LKARIIRNSDDDAAQPAMHSLADSTGERERERKAGIKRAIWCRIRQRKNERTVADVESECQLDHHVVAGMNSQWEKGHQTVLMVVLRVVERIEGNDLVGPCTKRSRRLALHVNPGCIFFSLFVCHVAYAFG
jgi:hypothetical protein